jgi:hypothetical protein
MKRFLLVVAMTSAGCTTVGPPASVKPPHIHKSQHGTVTQRVGFTDISIVYNRPAAHGRQLFPGVVPWGMTWNPGADSATSITFSRPVLVEEQPLASGSYSIWAVPGQESWTIIFSRAYPVWHDPYPAGRDALRVQIVPVTGEYMDVLAFYFPEVEPESAVLRLHWGTTVIPMRIQTVAATNIPPS